MHHGHAEAKQEARDAECMAEAGIDSDTHSSQWAQCHVARSPPTFAVMIDVLYHRQTVPSPSESAVSGKIGWAKAVRAHFSLPLHSALVFSGNVGWRPDSISG
jgi:hypothetical protein